MTNPFARIALAARGVFTDVFRSAHDGAEYVLDLLGPIGAASVAAGAVILMRW